MPAPAFSLSLKGDAELADALKRRLAPPELLADAAARGVSNLVVEHLRARNASASRREGFPQSGYWAKAAEATVTERRGCAARVIVRAPGIALHYKGGTVRPTGGKSLAIPARAEVAGVWPREYSQASGSGLFAWWPKGRSSGALARREDSGHLTILWWLVGATHHRPDPTVLPDEAQMKSAAFDAALSALDAYKAGRSA
jgi:hypothetical protein